MKIKIINPNTTQEMTDGVQSVALKAAAPGTEVWSVSPKTGPEWLGGYLDQAVAVPGLLEEIVKGDLEEGADAFVVACFGDPGLNACRQVTAKPVIGIAQSAMSLMHQLAHSFSFFFPGDPEEDYYVYEQLWRYGYERFWRSTHNVGIPILELEKDYDRTMEALIRHGKQAIYEEGSEGLILGCAGLAIFSEDLKKELPVPVLDGVTTAVMTAEALVRMGAQTSKINGYKFAPRKEMKGFEFLNPVMR